MQHVSRWLVAVLASMIGFAVAWWLAEGSLETEPAVTVAAVVAATIIAPLTFWASKSAPQPPASAPTAVPTVPVAAAKDRPGVGSGIIVGDIPGEAVAWQVRDHLLDRLRTLADSGRPAVVCAVTGQRGIGKTQLAAAYARQRVNDGWPVVVWILADTEVGLLTGLDQLAAAADVRPPTADLSSSATAALSWLRVQPGPCLLVYDNAVDPDLIRQYMPSVGAVQTIVTTTDRAFANVGVTVDVDLFTAAEAVAYLHERTGLADDAGARRVAEQLGRLPVALSQAGPVIGPGRPYPTYPAYLERLERVPVTQLLPRPAGHPYPRGAAEAILISLDDLATVDADGTAGQLLERLAVLAPTGVDAVLLHQLAPDPPPPRRWRRHRADGRRDAPALAAILAQRSLTLPTLDPERTMAHRLIQRVVRDRSEQTGRLDAAVIAAATAVQTAADHAAQHWPERDRLTEYAEHANALLPYPVGSTTRERVVRLLVAMLYSLDEAHSFATSVVVGPGWTAEIRRVLGPNHPGTLTSRNNLALAYRAVGRLEEAIEMHTGTLADCERVLGPDHPDTLMSRNNLANAYQAVGRLEEAIELYTSTLADRERVLGPDHPDTLASRNNLATAYIDAGRLNEAIELYTGTLADCERVLGPDHPDTLMSRNNLAHAYQAVGRLDEAIELYTSTLADHERVLGPDHPDTLASRNNLAHAYQAVGRLDEAIELYTSTLADHERVLGPDHPNTLTSQNNLASAYDDAGRLDEAAALSEDRRQQH